MGINYKRIKLTFSECMIQRPLIYEVAQVFNIVTNIVQANVTDKAVEGWVVLDVHGTDNEIEQALIWLADQGVEIQLVFAFDLVSASQSDPD